MNEISRHPVLGHIHVPKTAGSSVRQVLDDRFKTAHLHLYQGHGTSFVYDNEVLSLLFANTSHKAFSSHFVRRFPPLLAGRPAHYITFLRHPVQQFLSYIAYTRKYHSVISDSDLLSHLPPHMPDLSIRECARWILNEPVEGFRNFKENYTTNFFARYELLDCKGLVYDSPSYRERRLAAAERVLENFLLVGISEHLDESWSILRQHAAAAGIQLPDVRIPVKNVTPRDRDAADWVHPDDEVGHQVLASVEVDMQLYRKFSGRLRRLANQSKVA
jgi:hypothetical protein